MGDRYTARSSHTSWPSTLNSAKALKEILGLAETTTRLTLKTKSTWNSGTAII